MAVYDLAHRLAREIKTSEEYQNYLQKRQLLGEDEKAREMFLDYQEKQLKLQSKQLMGEKIPEEERQKIEKLREIIELNPKIKQYIEAEYRIGVLINDLQKILFGDLELGLKEAN